MQGGHFIADSSDFALSWKCVGWWGWFQSGWWTTSCWKWLLQWSWSTTGGPVPLHEIGRCHPSGDLAVKGQFGNNVSCNDCPLDSGETVRERLIPKINAKVSHRLLWKAGPCQAQRHLKQVQEWAQIMFTDGWAEQAGKRDTAPTPNECCSFRHRCVDSARFLSGMLGKKKESVRQRKQETQRERERDF